MNGRNSGIYMGQHKGSKSQPSMLTNAKTLLYEQVPSWLSFRMWHYGFSGGYKSTHNHISADTIITTTI